jgi:hypothetical protein
MAQWLIARALLTTFFDPVGQVMGGPLVSANVGYQRRRERKTRPVAKRLVVCND